MHNWDKVALQEPVPAVTVPQSNSKGRENSGITMLRHAACLILLMSLVASSTAVQMPSNRKMLALGGKVTTTAVVNPPPVPVPVQRQYRPYNQADAQFAANNQAIINTQYAIEAAVDSGADPYVTEAATNYGADQAYWASQATRWCGWHNGRWYRC